MKFDFAKTVAAISAVRMVAGAAAGNPADAAQVAQGESGEGVYNRRSATDWRRVCVYSAIVTVLQFASAPSFAALPESIALFMATFLLMIGYVATLRQSPLGTDIFSAVIVTCLYGLAVASVVCALNLAVGHPLDVALVPLGFKVALDCGCYLVLCWICDKVLRKCHRL